MYAVIETGGKQYRVELGSELHVELLDATPGSEVTFDRVLLVRTATSTEVGTPVVSGELHLIKVTEVAVNGTSAKALWEAGAAEREQARAASKAAAAEKAKADAALAEKLKVEAPAEKSAPKKTAAKKPAAKKTAAKKPADAE
jgi:large subunit ribosomal protein L21